MKALVCAITLLLITTFSFAQRIYQIKADSVRIYNTCDTAELIIENRTQDTLGFLYNKGRGRTEFRKLRLQAVGNGSIAITGHDTLKLGTIIKVAVDSIYQNNGTLYYRKTDGVVVSVPLVAASAETLQSVTDRGNSTDKYIQFTSASGNPSNGLNWHYNSDYWRIYVSSTADNPGGNMILEAGDNKDEGWIFRSRDADSNDTMNVLKMSRDSFLYKNNVIYHAGNIKFATKGDDIALKTEANGQLGIENWVRTSNNTGLYTPDGSYLYKNGTSSWALRCAAGYGGSWLELQTGDGTNRGGFFADDQGNVGIVNAGANGWRLRTTSSGNVYANGFYQTSMRSLKRDIEPFNHSALGILNTTSVRTFIYKADSAGIKHIGFIADELPKEMAAPGGEGVDESSTIALLVKALQEMNKKVESLQQTVETLQKKVAAYEK